jgi:hypothetical protein
MVPVTPLYTSMQVRQSNIAAGLSSIYAVSALGR